ncbi:20907_t:CDS:2, partial [Rhizophagus irregularis]
MSSLFHILTTITFSLKMSDNKKTEWTIIETFEEDDFICVDFYEGVKKGNNT